MRKNCYQKRKAIGSRISQGIELLDQGNIKSLEELAQLQVGGRPLSVLCLEFEREELNEWVEDEEDECAESNPH